MPISTSLVKPQVIQDTTLNTLGSAMIAAGMGLITTGVQNNEIVGLGLCILGLAAYWMKYTLSDSSGA